MELKSVLYETMHPNARRAWVVVATLDLQARQLIAAMLRDQGLDVSELDDALSLFGGVFRPRLEDEFRRPDLLVIETAQPGLPGLEVVRRVRRVDPSIPVVLLTARMDLAMAEEAEALGVECVLEHPFDYADLRAAALAALDP